MPERVVQARVGELLGPLDLVIGSAGVLAYAEASGDRNPIHVDPAFAATTPFGGPIAHGMLLLAYLSRPLSGRFGRAWAETGRLEARFRNPALVGTMVRVHGTVRAVEDSPAGQRIECAMSCDDRAGQALVTATARLTLWATEEACAKS